MSIELDIPVREAWPLYRLLCAGDTQEWARKRDKFICRVAAQIRQTIPNTVSDRLAAIQYLVSIAGDVEWIDSLRMPGHEVLETWGVMEYISDILDEALLQLLEFSVQSKLEKMKDTPNVAP